MFENIKLIISEIDGIITNGKVWYDELGNVPIKEYDLASFEVINKLKEEFIFVFMSAHNEINYNLMRRKNIPFYWTKNKKQTLLKILERYGVTADEVLYLGYSYSDMPCMSYIPISYCMHGSPQAVMSLANDTFIDLSELYELLKPEIARRKQCS